ncbi:MAG: 2,3-bisphosphoglycerate-independent phosphoglycerate mutase [Methanosarcinaceae archaeon]|nr:2,3-bisphosphoglycerate-independent phosphoglycerate mutase [Methanosarcinaceae archaeon]
MTQVRRPLMLMILDGWGHIASSKGNAILAADTPNLDHLLEKYPSCTCEASGEAVGLPEGQMGNSEVGHLNIGAGRIVYQDLTRINLSIKMGDFFKNPVLLEAIANAKNHGSKLHLMGLFSFGGVHSHMEHLQALVKLAKEQGLRKVYIHTFLDGRDVPPKAALEDMKGFEAFLKKTGIGEVAFVSGRYYAMDRDERWDRTELAYDALTVGAAPFSAPDPASAVAAAYARGENDEFVKPTLITDSEGKPKAIVEDNDSVIFFNFRPDRARQLTWAFVNETFEGFQRKARPQVHYVCMTRYDENLSLPLAFPPEELKNVLGEVLSREGKTQLRIAETEKYAHVTFFFNGGVERCYPGEDRCLIPSPKIATYDLKPEMSAYEVTDEVVKRIESGKYDVIILNFANMDMVGHTGIFEAAVAAVEAVDTCVGRVIEALHRAGGMAIVTADHGNAEQMESPETGGVHTAHTSNPVKLLYAGDGDVEGLRMGKLCDIAPTMLDLLDLEKPREMTGDSMIIWKKEGA